jgi:competence protein ComEC
VTRGPSPPSRPDERADPDVDGVALAVATAAGVALGARLPAAPAWVSAACCLAAAGLWSARASLRQLGAGGGPPVAGGGAPVGGGGLVGPTPSGRPGAPGGNGAVAGLLVLGLLLAAGGSAASVRATAVRRGLLVGWIGRPGRVEVTGAVAEEPRRLRYGRRWVVLTVDRVRREGRAHATRERAGIVLGRGGGEGRLGVGDRLRVRASVARARWGDALGRQPPVVLRHPVIEERAPPRGAVGGAALRVSEAVREAARGRALASLAPERAGLLVGMALGDTSLLPAALEGDFRAAGLTHLMAVSGANVAVVLAAGLWLAGVAGAGRRALAAVGVGLVALLVVVTRWEPSVLRAGVMAGLVLLGVASGRGPGGRRALCLAVVVLLLADPALAGALGFQLSVAATAGVLWLGPVAAGALPSWIPQRARGAVGMTLGAQAVAVPALALALGPLSLAGLPANLLGLPLAGGPMLLGAVAAATAPVAPWVADLACHLADPFLLALIAVARWAAGLPGGSITLAGPARAAPAAVVLVALAVARWWRSPYLARPASPPPDPERMVRARDDHRRRAPPGGPVPARGGGARDLGASDLPGPGQAVRHPRR